MRKRIGILFLAMLICMCGCGQREASMDERMITVAPEESTFFVEPVSEGLRFVTGGVELIPGETFDPSLLDGLESTYQVPSCAIEGTDNIYNYGSYEITAFDDGKTEILYSVYFLDSSITTPEGLALGDAADKVSSIYGPCEENAENVRSYEKENVVLSVILDEDKVVSIEYRMSEDLLKSN